MGLVLTGQVARLEGDHLVSVGFGVLRLTVALFFLRRSRGRHHSLREQSCQFGTRHILPTHRGRVRLSSILVPMSKVG